MVAASVDTAERTINNHIWNNIPLGGQLLRELHHEYGISIDWLVSGKGNMYSEDTYIKASNGECAGDNDEDDDRRRDPLIRYFEVTDTSTLTDYWWLTAKAIEQSLMQSGAEPGIDYSRIDLYNLAKPFVLERFKSTNLEVSVYAE